MLLSSTVSEHFNHSLLEGALFGVEVEVETHATPPNRNTALWEAKHDGSLRGPSKEYVMYTPSSLKDTILAVNTLYRRFEKNNVVVKNSMRAGVHVHVNQRDKTLKQVITFLCAYWLVEDYLIQRYCGEERAGNSFCLRLKDAELPLNYLFRRIQVNEEQLVSRYDVDSLRYAAVNIAALVNLGTLEFRSLRTPTTPEPLINWLNVLATLEDQASQFESPAELLDFLSGEGPTLLVNRLLNTDLLPELHDELFLESARRIQLLAYGIDWNNE